VDQVLYNYLLSGKAWLLVGSGPSIEMGYPTWEKLASIALEGVITEHERANSTALKAILAAGDYPKVFKEAKKALGGPRLLQLLRDNLKPIKNKSTIYTMLARWPIPVYMTTNYDDELQKHLADLGLAYTFYTNSEDHFGLLVPDFSGGIVKLHGDLTTENGLILTEDDYKEVINSDRWEYWRSKMAAIFQMNRVIVIGYSLSDKNVTHVLEAARRGAGVSQPVIWIAPNVREGDRRKLLNEYRIRVVPYEDRDGGHKNLVKLIETLNECIPPRTVFRVREQIEKVTPPPGSHVAASGFFVFNEFCKQKDFEEKRLDIVIGAMEAALPEISELGKFSLEKALELGGWPTSMRIDAGFASQLSNRAVEQGLFLPTGQEFQATNTALALALKKRKAFEHMRERFKNSVSLRVKREFPDLGDERASLISEDIESSLVKYFQEGGLSLASVLFSKEPQRTVPGSILSFITAVSTRYDNSTMRLAFVKTSLDAFVHPESAEIDYLGRISQGFFAFHGLGVFGDVAIERVKHAKETVWLVDSDTQIRALALGASVNTVYRECLARLKGIGLRFFTTSRLSDETREHLWFANNVIKENGPNSPYVAAAARGEAPFPKSNLFLEGFIMWQVAGNPCNWESYLYQIFGVRDYAEIDIKKALSAVGIEVIDAVTWPGFDDSHRAEIEGYIEKITKILLEQAQDPSLAPDYGVPFAPYKKATPEAEAYNIIVKERKGDYYIISERGAKHPAWFISHTSSLNLLEPRTVITWQPQAFLGFASTLCDVTGAELAKQAFGRLILGIAQSGVNLLDDETISRVFATVIDQGRLNIEELRQEYQETLQSKYGEPVESVLARVPAPYYPIAVTQLATEIAQAEALRRQAAEMQATEARKRAEESEKELERLKKYKVKLLRKQSKHKKKHRTGKRKRK